jgi:hypothetical protein
MIMAITCLVLCLLAGAIWYFQVVGAVMERVENPRTADQEEISRAFQEQMEEYNRSGFPSNPISTGAAIVGMLSGLGGLTMGVRSLLRQEPRRGVAIGALIVCVLFGFCQCILTGVNCVKMPTVTSPAGSPAPQTAPADDVQEGTSVAD